MNRLPTELQRLFLPPGATASSHALSLASPDGQVRAMVLEVALPASWDALAKAWSGAQADLELPAPAIAVNGTNAYQLWFSLCAPVAAATAAAFLDLLRLRYLPGIPVDRVAMRLATVEPVPARREPSGNWSAFVAPDLASLFADEPWLDQPPGDDAQADLLSRLQCAKPEAFARALERLRSQEERPVEQAPPRLAPAPGSAQTDPRQFLLDVMNDASVDMALRIEAAKALLPPGR